MECFTRYCMTKTCFSIEVFFLRVTAVQLITNHHHKMQMRHIKLDLCEIQACWSWFCVSAGICILQGAGRSATAQQYTALHWGPVSHNHHSDTAGSAMQYFFYLFSVGFFPLKNKIRLKKPQTWKQKIWKGQTFHIIIWVPSREKRAWRQCCRLKPCSVNGKYSQGLVPNSVSCMNRAIIQKQWQKASLQDLYPISSSDIAENFLRSFSYTVF